MVWCGVGCSRVLETEIPDVERWIEKRRGCPLDRVTVYREEAGMPVRSCGKALPAIACDDGHPRLFKFSIHRYSIQRASPPLLYRKALPAIACEDGQWPNNCKTCCICIIAKLRSKSYEYKCHG